jgi:hypothetical protein
MITHVHLHHASDSRGVCVGYKVVESVRHRRQMIVQWLSSTQWLSSVCDSRAQPTACSNWRSGLAKLQVVYYTFGLLSPSIDMLSNV